MSENALAYTRSTFRALGKASLDEIEPLALASPLEGEERPAFSAEENEPPPASRSALGDSDGALTDPRESFAQGDAETMLRPEDSPLFLREKEEEKRDEPAPQIAYAPLDFLRDVTTFAAMCLPVAMLVLAALLLLRRARRKRSM
jgi:hypothetical protein